MKLSLINENISKKDFFDFYALLHAATDGSHPKEKEISQRLKFLVDTIYHDHLNQLSTIVLSRISDVEFEPTAELLSAYGITWDEDLDFVGIDELDIRDRLNIISKIIEHQPQFGFTGDTWYKLADNIIEIGQASSLKDKILSIDRIYNLLHHGGLITDYMDESNWIEDALNFRDNANPNQILGQSSNDIRSLIGPSSYHGASRESVSDIDKLYTALRRIIKNKNGITIEKEDDVLGITGKFTRDSVNGYMLPLVSWGGVSNYTEHLEDPSYKRGELEYGFVWVEDIGNKFNIGNKKNDVDVLKPVKSYHRLANDIIIQVAKSDEPIQVGIATNDIKREY